MSRPPKKPKSFFTPTLWAALVWVLVLLLSLVNFAPAAADGISSVLPFARW
ncbi:hypothetical protein [Deinococcus hohokamensis]|uniref:Uncharacterized protein n=1 Tax=Deinococcus hohokamensis TaxID=309883 RepID=A0ABV9ICT5_9DEIO